jgi:hypothetical protein
MKSGLSDEVRGKARVSALYDDPTRILADAQQEHVLLNVLWKIQHVYEEWCPPTRHLGTRCVLS